VDPAEKHQQEKGRKKQKQKPVARGGVGNNSHQIRHYRRKRTASTADKSWLEINGERKE